MALPVTLRAIAVTTKSGSTCVAEIAGIETTIEVARDLSVTAGDALLVTRAGDTWYAICRTGTAPPSVPDAAPPKPPAPKPPQTGRLVISPVETRSRQGSRWRTDNDDVYQGEYGGNGNHVGCAFYGTKARSLDGATVTSAKLKIRRLDKGGTNAAQPTTLRLIAQSKKPSGAPTLGSSTAGPSLRRGSTNDAFSIPASWGQALVDGSAGGIGVYESDGSPYVILAGRGSWGPAFTLTLNWKR